jgi:hypothetical protein
MFDLLSSQKMSCVSFEEAMRRLGCTEAQLFSLLDRELLKRPKGLLGRSRKSRRVLASGVKALELKTSCNYNHEDASPTPLNNQPSK